MIGSQLIKVGHRLEATLSLSMNQSRQVNTRSIEIWWLTLTTQWSSPLKEKIAIQPMQLVWLPRLLLQPALLHQLKTRIMLSITHSITKEEVADKKDSSLYRLKIAQVNSLPKLETPIQVAWCPQAPLDPLSRVAKAAASVPFKPLEGQHLEDHRYTTLRGKMLTWTSLIKMPRTQIIPLTSVNSLWG